MKTKNKNKNKSRGLNKTTLLKELDKYYRTNNNENEEYVDMFSILPAQYRQELIRKLWK